MLDELSAALDVVVEEIKGVAHPVVLRDFPASGTSAPPPHNNEAFATARERQLEIFQDLATRAREVQSLGALRLFSAEVASAKAELRQQLQLPTEATEAVLEAEILAAGPRLGQAR